MEARWPYRKPEAAVMQKQDKEPAHGLTIKQVTCTELEEHIQEKTVQLKD